MAKTQQSNQNVSPDFLVQQWKKIEEQEMLYQKHPELFENIDDFAKEEDLS